MSCQESTVCPPDNCIRFQHGQELTCQHMPQAKRPVRRPYAGEYRSLWAENQVGNGAVLSFQNVQGIACCRALGAQEAIRVSGDDNISIASLRRKRQAGDIGIVAL